MTYGEILLDQGWTDAGLCGACGGAAYKYTKLIKGRFYEVKVYGKFVNDRTGRRWEDRGDAIISLGNSRTKVTKPEFMLTTLEYMKIAKEVTT